MQEAMTDLKDPHGRDVSIRMELGSGSVVAGVVGTQKVFHGLGRCGERSVANGIDGRR